MKKSYSVFIEMEADELADFLQPVLKKKGYLVGIPDDAERVPFENTEYSLEYRWEEEL